MKTLVLLCLISFLPQAKLDQKLQAPIPTIAVVQYGKVQITWLAGARAEYAVLKRLRYLTPDQQVRKAALEIALGTRPDTVDDLEIELLTPQEAERFRWQREPLQGRKR